MPVTRFLHSTSEPQRQHLCHVPQLTSSMLPGVHVKQATKKKCLFQNPDINEIYPSTGQANGGTEITVSGTVHNYMTVAVILNTGYSIPVNFTE